MTRRRKGGAQPPVDWEALRRLAAGDRGHTGDPSDPGGVRALLDARAADLARAVETGSAPLETIEVVTFTLARQDYALESRHLREIARTPSFVRVPGASPALMGIATHRGELIPVFDLEHLLGIPGQRIGELSRMVILGEGSDRLAFLADRVQELRRIPVHELQEPPAGGKGSAFLSAVTGEGLLLLDGDRLLTSPDLTAESER